MPNYQAKAVYYGYPFLPSVTPLLEATNLLKVPVQCPTDWEQIQTKSSRGRGTWSLLGEGPVYVLTITNLFRCVLFWRAFTMLM